jgi:CheY-like chemotaxis protein
MTDERPVLVVDDDADVREAIGVALADAGYSVAEASDGNEALEYLQTHPPPHAILLDWNMSPMNGSTFMKELGKSPDLGKVPVIVVTADIRADKGAAGPRVHWLTKPFHLDVLFELLRSPAPVA